MFRIITLATQRVRGCLDAFVNLESAAAKRIISLDDSIDDLNVEVIQELDDKR